MPAIASERDQVFRPLEEVHFLMNGGQWYDFYALLEVDPGAPPELVNEAIISRGADLLALTFTRGAQNELITALKTCYLDFRPVLLNPAVREGYDEQLALHRDHSPQALPYPVWRQEVLRLSAAARLARDLKFRSGSILKRAWTNLWDGEYI